MSANLHSHDLGFHSLFHLLNQQISVRYWGGGLKLSQPLAPVSLFLKGGLPESGQPQQIFSGHLVAGTELGSIICLVQIYFLCVFLLVICVLTYIKVSVGSAVDVFISVI